MSDFKTEIHQCLQDIQTKVNENKELDREEMLSLLLSSLN
jgi:hypothetical protein